MKEKLASLIPVALIAASFAWHFLTPQTTEGQIQLVLRNGKLLEVESIEFDEELVTTQDGRQFGWDEVLSCDIEEPYQTRFQINASNTGIPLLRIVSRLKNQDFASLSKPSEDAYQLVHQQKTTKSNARRHYIVCLGTFFSRQENHMRSSAIEPFLRLCQIERKFPQSIPSLPSVDISPTEKKRFFSARLTPIWFDKKLASLNLEKLLRANLVGSPGNDIYIASLAIAAEEIDVAKQRIDKLAKVQTEFSQRWTKLLRFSLDLKNELPGETAPDFIAKLNDWPPVDRAYAKFYLGIYHCLRKQNNDAILDWLYIPANFSEQFPALSAAAIYRCHRLSMDQNRTDLANIFRDQLSINFKSSYHYKLLIQE